MVEMLTGASASRDWPGSSYVLYWTGLFVLLESNLGFIDWSPKYNLVLEQLHTKICKGVGTGVSGPQMDYVIDSVLQYS